MRRELHITHGEVHRAFGFHQFLITRTSCYIANSSFFIFLGLRIVNLLYLYLNSSCQESEP